MIVKLTPNVANPAPVALAAEEGGADAVSMINTLKATALAPGSVEPWLGAGSGDSPGRPCGRSPSIRSAGLRPRFAFR